MSETLYLVTGAAGFLGGTICRQLVTRGEKVRAFALPNDPAIKYIPKEAEVFERRRIGKTYLVRESFNYNFTFQHTEVSNNQIASGLRKLVHIVKKILSTLSFYFIGNRIKFIKRSDYCGN